MRRLLLILLLLFLIMFMVCRAESFPKEVETNILHAMEHFKKGFPNTEAHRLIRDAYGLIEPGFDKLECLLVIT